MWSDLPYWIREAQSGNKDPKRAYGRDLHGNLKECDIVPLSMPLTDSLTYHIEELLTKQQGTDVVIRTVRPLCGGSVNDAFCLATDHGSWFLKTNVADRFPSMFDAEADGLALLRTANELRVPICIAQGEIEGTTFLLLEYIAAAAQDEGFQARFGKGLAKLHRHTSAAFGSDRNNYIALLPQVNDPHEDWVEFLIKCRFEPMVQMARDHQRIPMADVVRFERLYGKLPSFFPLEPPALLHGDLWKNNIIAAENGQAVLIDPAVYYGHREMDVAMTRMFGGFQREFYDAYQEEWPLEQGWEQRMDLCDLYPLLVHLNLFGGSYAMRVSETLRSYL